MVLLLYFYFPLLQGLEILFFFTKIFLWTFRNIPNFCFHDLLYFQNNECKKNLEIREGSQEQWKHTSTPYIFFSFTSFFLWTRRKIPYSFFLCPVNISRIMNAKKTRNPRRKSRAMETHFYPIIFFFSFTRFFLWTLTKIPYPFFMPSQYF